MAEKIEIEVLVGLSGEVTVTTHGLKGATCMQETEQLERAVGRTVRREKTREFYAAAKGAMSSLLGRKG